MLENALLLITLCNLGLLVALFRSKVTAYGAEKGKTLARKEDLDEILTEVRAVTRTQKEIESKLAGDLWQHQTRWNHKRDIYADLLSSLQETGAAFGATISASRMKADPRPNFQAEGNKNYTINLTRINESLTKLHRAMMLGLIFLSEESSNAIKAFIRASKVEADMNLPFLQEEMLKYNKFGGELVKLAKSDLGVSTN